MALPPFPGAYQRNALLEALSSGLDPNTAGPLVQSFLGQREAARSARQDLVGGFTDYLLQAASEGIPSDDAKRIMRAQFLGQGVPYGHQLRRRVADVYRAVYPNRAPEDVGAPAFQTDIEGNPVGLGSGYYSPLYNAAPIDAQDMQALQQYVREAYTQGLSRDQATQAVMERAGLRDRETGQWTGQYGGPVIVDPTTGQAQPNPNFDDTLHRATRTLIHQLYDELQTNEPAAGGHVGVIDYIRRGIENAVTTARERLADAEPSAVREAFQSSTESSSRLPGRFTQDEGVENPLDWLLRWAYLK